MTIMNPLDQLFNTGSNTHVEEYVTTDENTLVECQPEVEEQGPDAEDREMDRQLDSIHNLAIETFHNQTAYQEMSEPRYQSRIAEVAAQYLNIALTATTNKAKIKAERKKNNIAAATAGKPTTNNVVVASREEIMRMISVDADVK